ncbi:MAG: tetratricopeptide repeat protein [Alphaproteobacteria bacterium]|nr:tetratricopeptide repeat protein [Alphaproteobacteria bacterium]
MSKSLLEVTQITRCAKRNVAVAAAALLTSACAQSGVNLPNLGLNDPQAGQSTLTTGSIASSELSPVGQADALAATPLNEASSKALAKARKLRAANKKARALSVLDAASKKDPQNKILLRERGLLAADLGRLEEAKGLLRASIDPANRDWRTHSALGSALASEGRHGEAQKEFAAALKLAPDHPSVLNNLALSYALDGKHDRAEALLRQASTSGGAVKSKQNLALLLGLKGRTEESHTVAASVLPPETASMNSSYLRDLHDGNAKVSRADKKAAPSIRSARATTR